MHYGKRDLGLRLLPLVDLSKSAKSTFAPSITLISSKWLAIGAWQEMFKLIRLEDRPRRDVHHRIVLYNDDKNEIVINEVKTFLFLD